MLLRLTTLVGLALLLAGCGGGADAQRAQELLAQAQAAEARVTSTSYDLEVGFSGDGKEIAMTMTGGAYLKGKRAGDQYLRGSVLGAPLFDFVVLGKRAYLRAAGSGWQSIPRAQLGASNETADLGSAALRELTRYVKDVRVKEGQLVGGVPTATISGTLDTQGLVKAAGRLQGLSELVGDDAPQLSQFAENLGDTHAVLVLSERTRLLRAMFVDLTIEEDGKKIELRVIYRLREVNEPVRIPTPR